jgi:hypothetical protein
MTSTTTQARPQVAPATADRLWRRFIEARATALQTLKISDGIRAGQAWSEFLGAFVTSPPIVPGPPR